MVYKIDRLSRSLMDFSKLVEVFDRAGVTFVSVTQSFNTTTSMGRLTLNILLSFAQFEREVIAERVRDKIRASRQKGMWMGGSVPLGYVVKDRKLVVHEPDAAVVRSMFERFLQVGSATVLAKELRAEGVLTTKGRPIDKGYLYKCLSNRTYLGLAIHKGTAYPGEHAAIIAQDLWDKVHAILAENGRTRSANTRAQTPALLKGLIFGPTGAAMSPTHTRKGNRLYRYYVSQDVLQHGRDACPVGRVPAAEIEAVVIEQLRGVFRQPEIIVGTWRAAREEATDVTEAEVREALLQLDPLWDELFPAEQARIVQLLVERCRVGTDGIDLRLRTNGLPGLVRGAPETARRRQESRVSIISPRPRVGLGHRRHQTARSHRLHGAGAASVVCTDAGLDAVVIRSAHLRRGRMTVLPQPGHYPMPEARQSAKLVLDSRRGRRSRCSPTEASTCSSAQPTSREDCLDQVSPGIPNGCGPIARPRFPWRTELSSAIADEPPRTA